MTGNLSQLWSGPYPSYPLSRLRNGAYHGLVFLFSSRISPFKSLISQILPWFKPHPAFHILLPAKPMLAPLISDHKQSRWFTVLSLCLNSIKFFFCSLGGDILKVTMLSIDRNKASLSFYARFLLQYGSCSGKFGTTDYHSVYILVNEWVSHLHIGVSLTTRLF